MENHSHEAAAVLAPEARAVLQRGLNQLLRMTDGLVFRPLMSERYPLPLALAVYGEIPDPEQVRADIRARIAADPVSLLETALALFELYACNQPAAAALVPDDDTFLRDVFSSKRLNGWISFLGDADQREIQAALGSRWQFKYIGEGRGLIGAYTLLNMLARYAFVYGRVPAGDSHLLGHFIEDFTSGLLICRGRLNDPELVLSLAAMRIGVPAAVPPDYPFPFGCQTRPVTPDQMVEAVAAFPGIRRLLEHPDIPTLPGYLDLAPAEGRFAPAEIWGDTPESFYLLRKGLVDTPGVQVDGFPGRAMGVVLVADAEPLDAFDRRYIESRAALVLSRMCGVSAEHSSGRLIVRIAPGIALPPERIGESLIAAVRHEFPRILKVRAEIIFEGKRLNAMREAVAAERARRREEIESATEESVPEFITCVGCSAFAPDHVCIVTPERRPQCGRAYEFIKTGAHYGYDDMTNIHHRRLHSGMNSFGTCPKGELLDALAGEWSGVNQAAARLTGGRITRVQLHALEPAPHTGCGCFQTILFRTVRPKPGIGIMDRGYKGQAPDGRTWRDLHYALGGKQQPGLTGAALTYLRSHKFLAAHGGWESVVWVSPKIAALAGRRNAPVFAAEDASPPAAETR
jgi:hypothetical protein